MYAYLDSSKMSVSPTFTVFAPDKQIRDQAAGVLHLGESGQISMHMSWAELDHLTAFLTGLLLAYREGEIGDKLETISARLVQTMHPMNAPR